MSKLDSLTKRLSRERAEFESLVPFKDLKSNGSNKFDDLATKITQLENFDITGQKALVLAKAIINGEIKGLSYKPE